MKVGYRKRKLIIELKCLFYIPDESTTLAVMIPIPKYDDYGIYFFGWCNEDSSLPHVSHRYNSKKKVSMLSQNGRNNEPLLIFPKMEFMDDGSKSQLSEDRTTGIVSSISLNNNVNNSMIPNEDIPISSGLLDIELDPEIIKQVREQKNIDYSYLDGNSNRWFDWIKSKINYGIDIFWTLLIGFGIVGGIWVIYQMLLNPSFIQQLIRYLTKVGKSSCYQECKGQNEVIGNEKEEVIEDNGISMVDINEKEYREL